MTSADPLAGDPVTVRTAARGLERWADDVRTGADRVRDAGAVADAGWRGRTQQRFLRSAAAVEPAARRVTARIERVATVLSSYATEVERIQDEARRLRASRATAGADAESTATSIARQRLVAGRADAVESDRLTLDRLMSGASDIALLQEHLDEEWAELVDRRARVDRRAATELGSAEVLGWPVSFVDALATGSDERLLELLARVDPELFSGLATDPDLVERLTAMPAATIAAWWDSLGGVGSARRHSAVQGALVAAMPAVLGNLDGVAYWARDAANRLVLEREWRAARAALTAATRRRRAAVGRQQEAEAERAYVAALARRDALRNFRAGTNARSDLPRDVSRQMISFRPGPPPLGAVALGDVDRADSVTYLVPGMGSSLASTTETMRASANILRLHQLAGGRDETAIVSWLGYESPPDVVASGDTSVLRNEHAERGSRILAADLAALRERRTEVAITVIGHSYGSTTASLALVATPTLGVQSFITLGSAGIPTSVPDASALHVVDVYAAQAAERGDVAYLGRKYSGRTDPADDFGATMISTFSGERVDEHALLANSDSQPDRHGYLDRGTNTLTEVARVTR